MECLSLVSVWFCDLGADGAMEKPAQAARICRVMMKAQKAQHPLGTVKRALPPPVTRPWESH
eukprot:2108590-Amphidinium_carterae.2